MCFGYRRPGACGVAALDDPAFALDVLTAVGPGAGGAPLVGRVLDYLRSRVGGQTVASSP